MKGLIQSTSKVIARNSLLLIALSLLSGVATAQSCPNGVCPPVEVRGVGVDGRQILCRSSGCAGILETMRRDALVEMENTVIGNEDVPIDRGAFCSELKALKPQNCDPTTPPASPGINTTPASFLANNTNGCGDGSWRTSTANFIAWVLINNYSGNPDMPLVGSSVSFRSSCNSHDMCYAGGEERSTCDNNFGNNLSATCDSSFSSGSQGHTDCHDFATLYRSAVQTGGSTPYQTAASQRACAIWHKDMEDNECQK